MCAMSMSVNNGLMSCAKLTAIARLPSQLDSLNVSGRRLGRRRCTGSPRCCPLPRTVASGHDSWLWPRTAPVPCTYQRYGSIPTRQGRRTWPLLVAVPTREMDDDVGGNLDPLRQDLHDPAIYLLLFRGRQFEISRDGREMADVVAGT